MLGWYFTKGKGDLCIAIEYLPEGDLHSYLQNRPPLSEPESQLVIGQVLQGLSIMHSAGFAHRDIKPQVQGTNHKQSILRILIVTKNVLIQQLPTPDSSGVWWVKLADFGISRSLEATYSVIAIGTYDYMAPELFDRYENGAPMPDVKKADIWAVGVMTFYILTKDKGFQEWRSSFALDTIMSQDLDAHVALGREGVKVSLVAVTFVLGATAKSPNDRLGVGDATQHSWIGVHTSAAGPEEEPDEYVSHAWWLAPDVQY